MSTLDFAKKLQERTKRMAIAVILLARKLPKNAESKVIHYQLIKSVTSTAANYRAACRSRSNNEFIAKISIVIEEADETAFWLELISLIPLLEREEIDPVLKEAEEIRAITVKARQTTILNQTKQKK